MDFVTWVCLVIPRSPFPKSQIPQFPTPHVACETVNRKGGGSTVLSPLSSELCLVCDRQVESCTATQARGFDKPASTSGTRIRGLSGPDLPSRFTPLKGSAVSSQQSAVSINADAVLSSLSS